MAKQLVNIGVSPNTGGDPARIAFEKVNSNDSELYTALGADAVTGLLPLALPITKGGTGATTKEDARTNLGLGTAALLNVEDLPSGGGGVGNEYVLPKASTTTLGGIKVGNGLVIDTDGVLTAEAQGGSVTSVNGETGDVVVNAENLITLNGNTQQDVNDRGGATWYAKSGGYSLNDRVILDNGDEVRSTESSNTINPNIDMTDWINTSNKAYVGLSDVDNTSDINKPVSTATDLAIIAATQDKVSDQELIAAVAPKADLTYVDTALSNLSTTANKYYSTLGAANADIANIALNQSVTIGEVANGGAYYKATAEATTLTKSAYDPLTQAKNFTSEKAVIDELNNTDITRLVDVDGRPVFIIQKDGKVFLVGLNNDLSSVINALDVTDIISESSSTNILELKDANGVVALKLTADGDLFIPKIGNLTEEITRSKSSSQGGSLQAEHLAAKYADYALSQTQEYFETDQTLLTQADVSPYFSHSIYQVRIPAITRIAENKYLLCFEARESHDDFGLISLGSAILTVDLATKVVSTSNIQVLHEAFIDEQSKLRTFMNACTVKLSTGKIICLYARRYGTTEHQLYMRTSLDDGVTWSNHTDISAVKNEAGLNLLCPCSQGLVKRYGKNKGRIVFPVWTSGAAYNVSYFRSGYIYSDDDGATWNIGGFISAPSSNEVQCAEDLNGDLLFACRIELAAPYKIVVRLKDADDVWEHITPNINFNDGPVMSGLIQGDNIYDDSANKFMMSTCKNADRTGLLVHTSYDGGYTWRSYLLPSTIGQFVAYTCIENITPEFKLLIRENIAGGFNASVINLKNLIA